MDQPPALPAVQPVFQPGDDLPSAVRRMLGELCDFVIAQLSGPADETAVHEARKALKQARAVLRLARPGLPSARYRMENAALRDAGRLLSDLRDSAVLIATAQTIAADLAAADGAGSALDGLIGRLQAEHDARVAAEAGHVVAATDILTAVQGRLDGLAIAGDAAVLQAGVGRVYRDGRRLYRLIYTAEHPHAIHEWRKQVKYLWNQLRVLTPIWPLPLTALNEALHALSDLLGDEHDLAVLAAAVAARPDCFETAAQQTAVHDLIQTRRETLRRAAQLPAARIFAESPKAFAARLGAYYRAWQAEQAIAQPEAPLP